MSDADDFSFSGRSHLTLEIGALRGLVRKKGLHDNDDGLLIQWIASALEV